MEPHARFIDVEIRNGMRATYSKDKRPASGAGVGRIDFVEDALRWGGSGGF